MSNWRWTQVQEERARAQREQARELRDYMATRNRSLEEQVACLRTVKEADRLMERLEAERVERKRVIDEAYAAERERMAGLTWQSTVPFTYVGSISPNIVVIP